MSGRRCVIARATLLLLGWLAVSGCWAQAIRREPYSGYVYPAGCQAGQTVQVTVGGQNLMGANAGYFTGQGQSARIIEHVRPLGKKELNDLGQRLRILMRQRWEETMRPGAAKQNAAKPAQELAALPPVPKHPWLRNLDTMTLKELNDLRVKLFDPKRQPNSQLAEWVFMEIRVAPDAAAGVRELRLGTPQGLSNPVRFEVGTLPEVVEEEPNARQTPGAARDLPVVLNGQILPGDTDSFRFKARKGQKLVLQVHARSLTPYLADAVPGWFQATLALYDASGEQVAFVDDYRFSPDPVMFFTPPQDGEYVAEIRDSIYRGREDFVYRLSIGEQPFITRLSPLGGRAGEALKATVIGLNLPAATVDIDMQPEPGLRQTAWQWDKGLSNTIAYAVDTLPECAETEPNETAAAPQKLALPQIVNGTIGRPGDVDVYRFEGKAGETVVAEVLGRRLGSPVDSLLRLMDASGKVVAWNDDHVDPGTAWLTHHADSYVTAKLPKAGAYLVQVSEAQRHGGEEYAYRLRLSAPRPDFALRVTPSSVSMLPGRSAAITVHALRYDGSDGPIDVRVAAAPVDFTLAGGRIPAGLDHIQMTLAAPQQILREPVALRLEGTAQIGSEIVTRPAVPAEDMMQAFAYRHLVPCEVLLAQIATRQTPAFPITVTTALPLKIVPGGSTELQVKLPPTPLLANIRMQLSQPPDGITAGEPKAGQGMVTLALQAGPQMKPGYQDNLIIEMSYEAETKGQDGRARKWRTSLGTLPAIPFEVVKQ